MRIAFILDHPLMGYRIPFFNQLHKRYGHDIVVYHSGKKHSTEFFKQVLTPNKNILNTFFYRKIIDTRSHDIVICMQNIRMLNLWFLSFNLFRRYGLIQWGIGVSSSNGLHSERPIIRLLRNFLITFADSVVFYTPF